MVPDFFSRLKTALFGKPHPGGEGKSAEQADVMVKMNLPPLLGRRDAAYEKFEQEFSTDIADRPAAERIGLYRRWFGLLDAAYEDTMAVIVTLSNPDTSLRERRLANLLKFTAESLAIASVVASTEQRFFEGEEAIGHLAGQEGNARLRRKVAGFLEDEAQAVAFIGDLVEMTGENIRRHRDYTRKNFNAHNMARYQRAYADFAGAVPPEAAGSDESTTNQGQE